jgi:hypothetical protein
MTSQLEELLQTGEDLIGQIEDAKESLDTDLRNLNEAAQGIDSAVDELSGQANDLHRQIVAFRNEPPPDPIARATTQAIDNLLTLLTEAKTYFGGGNNLGAYGTLIMFDDHADDLRAAFRLCKMSQRRQP